MANPESSKSPAFQFYPKDFLLDGNVAGMSLQERGAYITLLCICWSEGSLPAEPSRLARFCGIPTTAFKRLWPALEPCFRADSHAHGRLIHPRLEREREKQTLYREQQSERGKLGGRPRKAGDKPSVSETQSQTKAADKAGGKQHGNPDESSSSSSSSSDFSHNAPDGALTRAPARGIGSGVMAGTLPRDHLRHAWCGRICVPEFLHGQFVSGLGTDNADAELRAFYGETMADVTGPIGEDSLKFWRARVAARWPAPGANESALTSALRRANEGFLKS